MSIYSFLLQARMNWIVRQKRCREQYGRVAAFNVLWLSGGHIIVVLQWDK
jgi:hypothetical protein